ncbi:MAG: hypothetical protein CVV07_08520 [Gammaproteobacteria bacterium HGW-Gammaproteobacteria-11]|nr:MAG: hypothetical protein CVV07_08520 [Gammaproteobacteria bacterium HGW-Gammaproteobacteria-11]
MLVAVVVDFDQPQAVTTDHMCFVNSVLQSVSVSYGVRSLRIVDKGTIAAEITWVTRIYEERACSVAQTKRLVSR